MKVVADFKSLNLSEQHEAYPAITAAYNAAKDLRRQELEREIRDLGYKPGEVRKAPTVAKYRGPNGEAYSGRGALPKWATDAGITTKEGMEKFRG
jgi:DNA-binding protein H-NS